MEEEDLISKAERAALRLEQANKVALEIVKRQEALEVYKKQEETRRILGGQSDAGVKAPEVSKEDKDKSDMQRYFKGTALERVLR